MEHQYVYSQSFLLLITYQVLKHKHKKIKITCVLVYVSLMKFGGWWNIFIRASQISNGKQYNVCSESKKTNKKRIFT